MQLEVSVKTEDGTEYCTSNPNVVVVIHGYEPPSVQFWSNGELIEECPAELVSVTTN